MTRQQIINTREQAVGLAHSAGNSVGEMLNVLLDRESTIQERQARMRECARVARNEIAALKVLMRVCETELMRVPRRCGHCHEDEVIEGRCENCGSVTVERAATSKGDESPSGGAPPGRESP